MFVSFIDHHYHYYFYIIVILSITVIYICVNEGKANYFRSGSRHRY